MRKPTSLATSEAFSVIVRAATGVVWNDLADDAKNAREEDASAVRYMAGGGSGGGGKREAGCCAKDLVASLYYTHPRQGHDVAGSGTGGASH